MRNKRQREAVAVEEANKKQRLEEEEKKKRAEEEKKKKKKEHDEHYYHVRQQKFAGSPPQARLAFIADMHDEVLQTLDDFQRVPGRRRYTYTYHRL